MVYILCGAAFYLSICGIIGGDVKDSMRTQADIANIFVVALAAFLTGLSKGGLGGMLGALVTALLALVMPLDQAVALALPILMFGDVFAVAAHWRRWERRIIFLLLPGALIGVALGTYVLTNVPATVLRRALGVLIILFISYRLMERRILTSLRYSPRPWHGLAAGGLSAFGSTLANAGGPPISIYLLLQDLAPAVFAATAALYFAVLNWVKVPYYYYAGIFHLELLLRTIWLAPLVPLGVWIGRQAVQKVDKARFEWVVLALLTISALLLLTR